MQNKKTTNYDIPDIPPKKAAKAAITTTLNPDYEKYTHIHNSIVKTPVKTTGNKKLIRDNITYRLFDGDEYKDVIETPPLDVMLQSEWLLFVYLFMLQHQERKTVISIVPDYNLCKEIGVRNINELIETLLSIANRPLRVTTNGKKEISKGIIYLINVSITYDKAEYIKQQRDGTLIEAKSYIGEYVPSLKPVKIDISFPTKTMEEIKEKYLGILMNDNIFSLFKNDLQRKFILYIASSNFEYGFTLNSFFKHIGYNRAKLGVKKALDTILNVKDELIKNNAFITIDYDSDKELFYNIKKNIPKSNRKCLPEMMGYSKKTKK